MQFVDTVTVSGKTRRTADGFLVATAKSVRTGIQLYAGYECGMADKAVVRVYRSPEDVFNKDSLQSFSHAPVTIDHPSVPVTAANWKQLAVGEVSTAAQMDGQWVSLPLVLKDAAAIEALEGGKRQLSAGYVCQLDATPGFTPEGEAYDARQVGIKINHLALVDRARAGDEARIGDSAEDAGNRTTWGVSPLHDHDRKEARIMADTLTTVVLGDKAVQVADKDAPVIELFKKAFSDEKAKLVSDHLAIIDAKDEEIGTLKAENKKLTDAAMTPEKVTKLVADRVSLENTAKAIVSDVKTENVADADLRKAVVLAKYGPEFVADASEGEISGMFKTLAKHAVADADPVRNALRDSQPLAPTRQTKINDAYDQMRKDLESAYTGGVN